MVKGYKVFESDWTCRGFQYEVGKTFVEDVTPSVCSCGFHFCEHLIDCFLYYTFDPKNKVAEVVALGDVDRGDNKSCTNKIQIVRELSWIEVLNLVNTGEGCTGLRNAGDCNTGNDNNGDYNTGYGNEGCYNTGDHNTGNFNTGNNNIGGRNTGNHNSGTYNTGYYNTGKNNSGDRNSGIGNSGSGNSGNKNSGSFNTGDFNTGCYNSGDMNTGDHNSGDFNSGEFNSGDNNSGSWNTGNYNSGDFNECDYSNGCFNTADHKIYLFDKPSEWTYRDWLSSKAYFILMQMPSSILESVHWTNMTEEEKKKHPEAEKTDTYLRECDATEKRKEWWGSLSYDDKAIVTSLPNFDKNIFRLMTGINIDE